MLVSNVLCAQKKNGVRDSLVSCGFVALGYGYFLPAGDLYTRFGNNSTIGTNAGYKSIKNNFFTFEWNYIFGNNVKENGILDSISTTEGYLIDVEGKLSDIRIFERGFTTHLQFGHLFPIKGISPNDNSGLLVNIGLGYFQHKIRIYDNGARSPQLSGDYLKGYDRLTSGISSSQFIGYWYMSNSRFVNVYAGFEVYEAISKSRRSWDFDLMRADTRQRFDAMYGFRVGWVIPLYRSTRKDDYI